MIAFNNKYLFVSQDNETDSVVFTDGNLTSVIVYDEGDTFLTRVELNGGNGILWSGTAAMWSYLDNKPHSKSGYKEVFKEIKRWQNIFTELKNTRSVKQL